MSNFFFDEFVDHWKSLPFEDGLPNITSLKNNDFDFLDQNIFVMERLSDDYFPISRFGDQVRRIYNQEMKGLNFLGLFSGKDRNVVQGNINNIIDHRCGGMIGTMALRPSGANLEIRTYGLPFRNTDGEENMIVGYSEVLDENMKIDIRSRGSISMWPLQGVAYFDIGNGLPI